SAHNPLRWGVNLPSRTAFILDKNTPPIIFRSRSADSMSKKVKVGLIGSQFISHIHAISLKRCGDAELFAVASPTPPHARDFAAKHGIPHHFTDYKKLF